MSTTILERPAAPVIDDIPAPPRLSEALRKGAQYHRQGHGYVYSRQEGTTCALGALAVGLLGPRAFEAIATSTWTHKCETLVHEQTGVWLDQPLLVLDYDPAVRPLFKTIAPRQRTLAQALVYLNDVVCWSRERIADWLESIGY